MIVDVYPSSLPGEPLERHETPAASLHAWLVASCPSYRPGPQQPVLALLDGHRLPAEDWDRPLRPEQTVELRPIPRGPYLVLGALLIGAVAVAIFARPKIPGIANIPSGQSLRAADLKANTPRLNGIIPEIAGRYKIFPDYLTQPRKYFNEDRRSQSVNALLCIGQGEYLIDDDEVYIEGTPLNTLTDISSYTIFAPGASLAGTDYCQNWYNSREVGNSTGSSGLRLTAGVPGTPAATATAWRVDADSISIPPGAGVMPQDWETGNVINAVVLNRTIEIVDGGGQWYDPLPDEIRGSFSDLDLAVGDIIEIYSNITGTPWIHKVKTISTSVNDPGSASTIVGSAAALFNYGTYPASFELNGFIVYLDSDYTDVANLIADIEAQIAGVTLSESSGVITVTEDSPYSGAAISLTGYSAQVFGATPTKTTGTKTQSYDVLTTYIYQCKDDEYGDEVCDWVINGNSQPGTYAGVDIQKEGTKYRIESIITGTIPGGTGTIGFEFQRLLPNGYDDTAWTGWPIGINNPTCKLELDSSTLVGGWVGPFRATPAGESTQYIEYDVFFPNGMAYIDDDGKITWHQIWFEVQWRSNGGDWSSPIYHVIGDKTKDQLGLTISLSLPSAYNKVDLRMRRTSAEQTSLSYLERIEWYGLRSRLADINAYAGVTTIGVTLNGSDKISTQSENKINLVVTRKLNGVASRSIAEWAKYVCGTVGYASTDLNEDEFDALAAVWDARGDYYDNAIVSQTTVKKELGRTLQAGFAEFTIDHGQIRPVRDQARTTYEQMYTPQNMLEPLKRQFEAYDPDDYNGVDVEFINADTWENETIECRLTGDVGTRVENISLEGVTDRTKAWRIGMRERRIQKYRRKSYRFKTELDALNSKYLSYCLLSDDVPGYSVSAIVTGYESENGAATITVTESFVYTAADYRLLEDGERRLFEDGSRRLLETSGLNLVALRRPDGSLSGPYTATRIDDFTFTISEPDFTPITLGSNANESTHVIFGHVLHLAYPVLITEINPQGETVAVVAVNYDARVYADDDNSPD